MVMLVTRCAQLFSLPVIIVAQNWKNEISSLPNCKIINYENKLGITGARKELRRIFLESEFDYLIMLDDDCDIQGQVADALLYLKQIDEHPNMYGVFKPRLLKLFAISKEMFQKLDYWDGEAENGEIFEDMLLMLSLEKLYPEKKFEFKVPGLREISDSAWDKYSTWFHYQFDKHAIGDNTRAILKEL